VTYALGVDLGTSFTAAATGRGGGAEMVSLGSRSIVVPSVAFADRDDRLLTGDAADRRAMREPGRTAREFKRLLGDPTPLLLGGAPFSPSALLAAALRDAVEAAARVEGAPPRLVVLTRPAVWGPYRREQFDEVPRLAGLDDVHIVTEPVAAATYYTAARELEDGDVVAVYDLGGGTFDTAVLLVEAGEMRILGSPEGVEWMGGADFDEAVLRHIDGELHGAVSAADPHEPGGAAALYRLRQECTLAKETLSFDEETTVPVFLTGAPRSVRLTRAQFEDMIRPSVASTVEALHRALASADVRPADLSAVLLAGGSSRIPLVSRMVEAAMGRPTVVNSHPKHLVALGAARIAARRLPAAPAGAPATRTRTDAPEDTRPHEHEQTPPQAAPAVPRPDEAPAAEQTNEQDGQDEQDGQADRHAEARAEARAADLTGGAAEPAAVSSGPGGPARGAAGEAGGAGDRAAAGVARFSGWPRHLWGARRGRIMTISVISVVSVALAAGLASALFIGLADPAPGPGSTPPPPGRTSPAWAKRSAEPAPGPGPPVRVRHGINFWVPREVAVETAVRDDDDGIDVRVWFRWQTEGQMRELGGDGHGLELRMRSTLRFAPSGRASSPLGGYTEQPDGPAESTVVTWGIEDAGVFRPGQWYEAVFHLAAGTEESSFFELTVVATSDSRRPGVPAADRMSGDYAYTYLRAEDNTVSRKRSKGPLIPLNLMGSPDFETGPPPDDYKFPWGGTARRVECSPTGGFSDTCFLRYGSISSPYASLLYEVPLLVQPGDTFTAEAVVRCPPDGPGDCTPNLVLWGPGGSRESPSCTIPQDGKWYSIRLDLDHSFPAVPDGKGYFEDNGTLVRWELFLPRQAGRTMEVDQVLLAKGSTRAVNEPGNADPPAPAGEVCSPAPVR
jgi:actin-like ATPase involved in cell morphogenesis